MKSYRNCFSSHLHVSTEVKVCLLLRPSSPHVHRNAKDLNKNDAYFDGDMRFRTTKKSS